MKKIFYTAIIALSMQFGFAQTADALTYVNNMGVTSQIQSVKEQLLPAVETGKQEDFNKEFDKAVNDFVTKLAKLIDDNYISNDIVEANKKFNVTKEFVPSTPKDINLFQDKAQELQNEIGITLQGLIMKYADQAMLDAAQE